ncbi:Cupredoxin-like domain-containing protein [Paenibacillus taihuensis]|uniref:Cupredoxin-like domain-containing protein n=1 Tax=Paenibacillus taihuensis TaxID=1156355 RepID=A0A3D9SD81_9BACL|nr:cupredoxin domain-containing protein [Paenibacillus taihuensis]REE91552.1 Cupredoxin-like domain-containing protein [Paenibacillus taihuensis]
MKKKLISLAVSLTAAVVVLSACGSTANQGSSPNQVSSVNQSSSKNQSTAENQSTAVNQSSSATSTSTTKQTSTAPSKSASLTSAEQTVEIKLMAKDFEYDQKEIHVKKGDKVKITLQSDDGGHGFTIPAYKVTINGNGSAVFTADKAGKFEYHCSVFCGSGHKKMTGTLIVV